MSKSRQDLVPSQETSAAFVNTSKGIARVFHSENFWRSPESSPDNPHGAIEIRYCAKQSVRFPQIGVFLARSYQRVRSRWRMSLLCRLCTHGLSIPYQQQLSIQESCKSRHRNQRNSTLTPAVRILCSLHNCLSSFLGNSCKFTSSISPNLLNNSSQP